jgi:hypothetical protein
MQIPGPPKIAALLMGRDHVARAWVPAGTGRGAARQ